MEKIFCAPSLALKDVSIYLIPHDAGFFALVGLKDSLRQYAQNGNDYLKEQRTMDLVVIWRTMV